jgi:hypothetical protein
MATAKKKVTTSKKPVKGKTVSNAKVKKETLTFDFKEINPTQSTSEKIKNAEANIQEIVRYSNTIIDMTAVDAPDSFVEKAILKSLFLDRKLIRLSTFLAGQRQIEENELLTAPRVGEVAPLKEQPTEVQ